MRRVWGILMSLVLLAAVYAWFSGIRIGFTPSYTITAVKLYAIEADASARTDNYLVLPVRTKCYVTKIGSKYNAVRVRCDDPAVEGWVRQFNLFEPPL
ncbi:exported hypothetical protein [Cupriavidus taiwanensis]|nr:exported hypothetical protein [Cupriavidus taiwanensis]